MSSENKLPNPNSTEEHEALQALIRAVTGLDPIQVELLTEFARIMLRKVEETISPGSDFATPRFAANFRNRLLIHHATNEAKLTKKPFEFAFKGACEADGKTALITQSDTLSGADVIVDGIRFSMKTEASKNIQSDQIVISKFTEARWIQQQTTLEGLAKEAATRIPGHLNNYDRILVLRVRELPDARLHYEIVEIPLGLLRRIQSLTVTNFSARTRQGGSSAKIMIGGDPAFTLRLDGSDGKVTLTGLKIKYCLKHVAWTIPTVAPAPEDSEEALFAPAETPPGD